jgi:hypothetical protein
MTYQHRELAAGRWNELSFVEQMANVGSEVERTISWRKRDNAEHARSAFERALELIDLTIADLKNLSRLKEIVRTREVLADHFAFDNVYRSSDKSWQDYFLAFNYAARINA